MNLDKRVNVGGLLVRVLWWTVIGTSLWVWAPDQIAAIIICAVLGIWALAMLSVGVSINMKLDERQGKTQSKYF